MRARYRVAALGLALAGVVGCASQLHSSPPETRCTETPSVEIAVVVVTASQAAVEPEVLGEWVGRAAAEFAHAGLEVRVRSVEHVGPDVPDPRRPRGRRALAKQAPPGVVPVAIVPKVRRGARGLWYPREGVIVLGANASTTALAHELGHTRGLEHTLDPTNIMCSCDREGQPTFSFAQRRALRTGAGD